MAAAAPNRRVVDYDGRQVQIFASSADLEAALGPYLSSIAVNAVQARGKFTVAFSGGSLPATVGSALTTDTELAIIKPTLNQWHVFYADERCVPLSDKESNHSVVSEKFLSKLPSDATITNIYPFNEALADDPNAAATDYQARIERLLANDSDQLEFDCVLLGMGPDGHTCSLFPGHPLLKEHERLVSSLTDSPKPPPSRITFTLPLVNKARHAVFVITGDKADALHSVLETSEGLPSSFVKATNTVFFVDEKAAAKLSKAKL